MDRAFYLADVEDDDFDYLISQFLMRHPQWVWTEQAALPIVLIPYHG